MPLYKQKGFALIALLLALAIIVFLAVMYLKPANNQKSLIEQQKQAEKSVDQTNKTLQNYQNQINQQQ